VLRVRGGIADPIRYGKAFTLVHDPMMWREATDYLFTQARVNVVFYHTIVTATLCDGDKVEGVEAVADGKQRISRESHSEHGERTQHREYSTPDFNAASSVLSWRVIGLWDRIFEAVSKA
jgi:hypothetical protein